MTEVKKAIIKTNRDDWAKTKTINGHNKYITSIDNYMDVKFSQPLVYIGNHPPEIEQNNQYKAAIKHVKTKSENYYLLVNSSEKTGPLYFEKYVKATTKGGKTSMVHEKIEEKQEAYIADLINIDGVGEKTAKLLVENNIKTIRNVAEIDLNDLKKYDGIGTKTAERIKESAITLAGIKENYEKFKRKQFRGKEELVKEDKGKPIDRGMITVSHNTKTVDSIPKPGTKNTIDFGLFDTDKLSKQILTAVQKGSKNSMDYKVKGRTLRSSQMGKDHAYIFLDTYYNELPKAWKDSIIEIEEEHLEGNLGSTTPGTTAHEYFQAAMEAVADKYQEVQLLSHELPLVADYGDFRSKGHYDGLLRVKDTSDNYQLMVMDIKTTGGKWYDILVKNFEKNKNVWQTHLQRVANREVEYNPTEISNTILDFTILDPYHIVQLHDYMNKMGTKHAIIAYVSKKDYSVYLVYVPFVEAIVEFMMDWGRQAIEYRKQLNVIPPAIYDVEEGEYVHYKTGDRLSNKQKDILDYPCRKADKRNILKYQCKFIRICYDRKRLGKYSNEM